MQALANLNQWKGDHDIDRNHGGGSSSFSKHSQPAFPGHPPPLVRLAESPISMISCILYVPPQKS